MTSCHERRGCLEKSALRTFRSIVTGMPPAPRACRTPPLRDAVAVHPNSKNVSGLGCRLRAGLHGQCATLAMQVSAGRLRAAETATDAGGSCSAPGARRSIAEGLSCGPESAQTLNSLFLCSPMPFGPLPQSSSCAAFILHPAAAAQWPAGAWAILWATWSVKSPAWWGHRASMTTAGAGGLPAGG